MTPDDNPSCAQEDPKAEENIDLECRLALAGEGHHGVKAEQTLTQKYPSFLSTRNQVASTLSSEYDDHAVDAQTQEQGVGLTGPAEVLTHRLATGLAWHETRRDPMVCFPNELLYKIFQSLSQNQHIVCTTVNRTWQRCLLQMPFWDHLTIHLKHNKTVPDCWSSGLYLFLNAGVHSITIHTEVKMCPLLSLLNDSGAQNVKQLVIHDSGTHTFTEIKRHGRLRNRLSSKNWKVLSVFGSHLTDLRIDTHMNPRNMVRILLQLCPSLILLSYNFNRDAQFPHQHNSWHCSQYTEKHERLYHTALRVLEVPSTTDFVCQISSHLPILPELRALHIVSRRRASRHSISTLVDDLLKQCPNIQYFYSGYDWRDPDILLDQTYVTETQGLTTLYLSDIVTVDDRPIENLMLACQDTLTEFTCCQYLLSKQILDILGQYSFVQFSKLGKLRVTMGLYDYGDNEFRELAQLLRLMPSLENVHLQGQDILPSVSEAISNLPRLRSIMIGGYSMFQDDAFRVLVQGLTQRGAHSMLEEFVVNYRGPNLSKDEVLSLGSFAAIRSIRIHDTELISCLSSREVIERLARNMLLSGSYKTLEELEIPMDADDRTKEEAKKLLNDTCPHLKRCIL